jgi:predicted alpha/beta-fold hydrolase
MDASDHALIRKLGLEPFRPIPLIKTGKMQTIAGNHWPQAGELHGTTLMDFDLGDDDQLVLAVNTAPGWREGGRIIVLVHGLTGSYTSNYMIRMARAFTRRGAKVYRMNLRCCGPGMGKSRRPYHCGISEDTRQVVQWISKVHPKSPITQIGFSLGGNISLKMAGEDGARPTGNLDSMIAVSPPVDVKESSRRLSSPQNSFFDWHFTRRVLNDVQRLHRHFPDLPPYEFPKKMNIYIFDDLYTAPRCGFKDGEDYYRQASSFYFLDQIRIPTFVIGASDDPVVSGACFHKIPRTPWIEKVISDKGGHVGFLGFGARGSIRWADQLLLRWAEEHISGLSPLRQSRFSSPED